MVPHTPDEIREYLKKGKPIHFEHLEGAEPETEEGKAARTIQASWIEELASEPERIIHVPIEINNAIIQGQIQLAYTTFQCEVCIANSEFTDRVDLSFSTFNRTAKFDGSVFQRPAIFRAVQTKFDFTIDQATFPDETSFADIQVEETLSAAGARFGSVSFYRAHVKKAAIFRPALRLDKMIPVRFGGELRFVDASINGIAVFVGAQFEGAANFERIHIGSSAFFRSEKFREEVIATRFKRDVNFLDAHIEGNASFDGTQFDKTTSFERVKIGGSAFFRGAGFEGGGWSTRFSGPATFTGASIEGNVDFNGAQFDGDAHFDRIQVNGIAFFNPILSATVIIPTRFAGEANFIRAQIRGGVSFNGVQFEKKVKFNSMKVGSDAVFRTVAHNGEVTSPSFSSVEFTNANIQGLVDFEGSQFKGRSIFDGISIGGNALFRTVRVGDRSLAVRFESDATFSRAHIQGIAEFTGAHFEKQAYFDAVNIEGDALFRAAVFGDDVTATTFKGDVRFTGCHIKGTTTFDCAQFEGGANFDHIKLEGDAYFRSGIFSGRTSNMKFCRECSFFNADIRGSVDFRGAMFQGWSNFTFINIGGNAIFSPLFLGNDTIATHFGDRAIFLGARISGRAEFSGVQFEREAIFHNIKISNTAAFNSIKWSNRTIQSEFKDIVNFTDATIGAQANFNGCLFNKGSGFDRAKIGGDANFSAHFRESASFLNTNIQGDANFDGAQFDKLANFEFVRVAGNAFFRSTRTDDDELIPVCFEGDARFFGAQIQGVAEFLGTQFKGSANFAGIQIGGNALFSVDEFEDLCTIPLRFCDEVSFDSARFKGRLTFQHAHFAGPTFFERTTVEATAKFDQSKFGDFLSLRDAHFHTVYLNDEPATSGSHLLSKNLTADLLGFSYDRITADWRELFNRMDEYDRQPYTQLEKVIRATGNDREADDVYLARRRMEMRSILHRISHGREFREVPRFLFDGLQKVLFNYGVRPYRLLSVSAVILLIGTYMFMQPGAVKLKERPTPGDTYYQQSVQSSGEPVTLNWSQSLGLSLRSFIPIVEIYSGSQWTPTENAAPFLHHFRMSFAAYASLHRLAGFILVPLGVAILAGFIRRQAKQ